MTAHKLREPGSFPHAVTQIRDRLGADAMAAELGYENRQHIDRMCDPDHASPKTPTVREAVALDLAYVRATREEPPILQAFRNQIETRSAEFVDRPNLPASVSDVSAEMNDIIQAITAAMGHNSEAGSDPSPRESRAIVAEIDEAVAKLQMIRRRHCLNASGAQRIVTDLHRAAGDK